MKLNGAFWIGFLPCFFVILTGAASGDVNFDKPVPAQRSISSRNTCKPGFVNVQEHCYYFSEEVFNNWDDALRECHRHNENSFLVQIETTQEWNNIKVHLTEEGLSSKNWWIGASDREDNTRWEWVASNRPLSQTNWCRGKPTSSETYNCAHILKGIDQAGRQGLCWTDYHCTKNPSNLQLNFICEHE